MGEELDWMAGLSTSEDGLRLQLEAKEAELVAHKEMLALAMVAVEETAAELKKLMETVERQKGEISYLSAFATGVSNRVATIEQLGIASLTQVAANATETLQLIMGHVEANNVAHDEMKEIVDRMSDRLEESDEELLTSVANKLLDLEGFLDDEYGQPLFASTERVARLENEVADLRAWSKNLYLTLNGLDPP